MVHVLEQVASKISEPKQPVPTIDLESELYKQKVGISWLD
jgi:hypothetical protein